jgi:signal transduction histidine kinase
VSALDHIGARVSALPARQGPATTLAAAILAASALLAADAAGLLRLGWGWATALTCGCAGLGLIAVSRPSSAMYVGALARLSDRPVSVWALRAAAVATAPLAGIGPVAYALLALAQALHEPGARGPALDWRRALGTGLLGLGFVVGATEVGFRLGSDALLWPVLGAAAGLSGFWWSSGPSRAVRLSIAAALAFVLLTLGAFTVGEADGLILAGIAGAVVVTIVVGPRWLRSSRALAAERAHRARVEERAEVAELVHDSVLQTLALIQSRADDPAEVKALARRQERDLRARLFDEADGSSQPTSIATALRDVAAEVEDEHKVKIEVVTVGDAPLDERSAALVAAAREALFNAVRHAPEAPVSLFAEVDDRQVAAYVRDRGPGFDLEAIPADRRGITDSIVARMVRHGGHAAIRTAPGGGCEVRLVLERRR